MIFSQDDRIVLTLDAGGTNFVFAAYQHGAPLGQAITLPSNGDNLDKCLATIRNGFETLEKRLPKKPVAISFAFPGPADYAAGIIGDLNNLPAFKGGVALGPFLQHLFNMPVFINNDGDLFAYGEAMDGFLPEINTHLRHHGSHKQFRHLFGITLGTGFGGGFVVDGKLFIGDNAAGSEIWISRNFLLTDTFAEESISKRAIGRVYNQLTKDNKTWEPKEIFDIAKGLAPGDKEAARQTFTELGRAAGDVLANVVAVTDCLVVIGGGIIGAAEFILPAIVDEMNRPYRDLAGNLVPRTELTAFNLEDKAGLEAFTRGREKEIPIPGTNKMIIFDEQKRTGVGISRLGTSNAISVGAYVYALNNL